jgi:hypothetical protein
VLATLQRLGTVNIYVCVRKVLCRSILTQVVLSVVSALCWKQFQLKKKELLQVVPLKMDRFFTRKRDGE